MKNVLQKLLRVLIPIAVVALGAFVFMSLVRTKPQAERAARPDRAPLVEVAQAVSQSHVVTVHGQGEVVPAQRVVLQPELTGRVVWQADELVPGGRFRANQPILRIDPRNYSVTIEQQQAQLERSQMELELERGRQVVAQREWELFGGEPAPEARDGGAPGSLALRQPQVRNAQVAVKAARSALDRARLDLRKTTLTAPFNAMVQAESVDVGQLVSPQTQVATLVGTDQFWVQVSVPLEMLQYIDVPGVNGTEGSPAQVVQDVGEQRIERQGRIMRLLGDLDPVGRMARVIVAIDDPMALEDGGEGESSRLPLLIGAYVDVHVEGDAVDGVIEVPRTALREGDQLYVMNDERRLEIRDVEIAWRTEDTVLVRSGIAHGEQLVTSRVPTPVAGMELRTASDGGEEPGSAPRAEAEKRR